MSDELRFEIAQNMQRKLVDNLKDKVRIKWLMKVVELLWVVQEYLIK